MPTPSLLTDASAAELVAAVNARRLGHSEFREVRMTIGHGLRTHRLTLRSLRHTVGGRSRTLVCLMEPRPLRNINYVMSETKGSVTELEIDLYLPYARGTFRRLEAQRRREGALGSDFAYDDLRTWLYEEGHDYLLESAGPGTVEVRGRCMEPELAAVIRSGAAPFRLSIDVERSFVCQVDYLDNRGSMILRSHAIHATKEDRGVIIPTKMEMIDYRRKHSTTIELMRSAVDVAVQEEMFQPAARRRMADHLSSF